MPAMPPVASVPFVAAHRLAVFGAFLRAVLVRAVLVRAVLVRVGGRVALCRVGLGPRVRHFSTLNPRPRRARACPTGGTCDNTRPPRRSGQVTSGQREEPAIARTSSRVEV